MAPVAAEHLPPIKVGKVVEDCIEADFEDLMSGRDNHIVELEAYVEV